MPTEQLILRRVFPVPVTFADLRRAHESVDPDMLAWLSMRHILPRESNGLFAWHAAIKEATGALDEVYAVIDGREVRVATIDKARATINMRPESSIGRAFNDLLIAADEAGYWQRPHEVRHVLEEPQMSHKTMARIAGNSFIVAGSK